MATMLRCRDLQDACVTVAALLNVTPEVLALTLPEATRRAHADQADPIGILPTVLADMLERDPVPPVRVHYFHGTRSDDPQRLRREGLRPLSQVLDHLWHSIAMLLPELSESDLDVIRRDLTTGSAEPYTYSSRLANVLEHGPCGVLIQDELLSPGSYGSVDYFGGAEIAIDICRAIEHRTGLDATERYRRATAPCVVEFSVATSHFNGALASALWYIDAGQRGQRTTSARWGFCAEGRALAAHDVVAVFTPDRAGIESRHELR